MAKLKGMQKAALFLMGLDRATAGELIKGIDPETAKQLAVELAYLDAAGYRNSHASMEMVREFTQHLDVGGGFHLKSFMKEILKSSVGEEKAEQVQQEIGALLQKRDPFLTIRQCEVPVLTSALSSEHPRTIAVILSELDPRKSSEVLKSLDEQTRLMTIERMTGSEQIPREARTRIAESISERLTRCAAVESGGDQSLRKVAVILRNLGKELRDGLMGTIKEKDDQTAEKVASLMIVWDDIPSIGDRSLQEALRNVESQKLALALHKAPSPINEKIRKNISERAAASLDEEAALMSAPSREDIAAAREEIIQVLREMNENGKLRFIEE